MKRKFDGVYWPIDIWLTRDLNLQQKAFLIEINSLDGEDGCFASNKHFSEVFGLSKNRCTEVIKQLEAMKLIRVKYVRNGKRIVKRVLNVLPNDYLPIRKIEYPYSRNSDNPIRDIEQPYSRNREDSITNNSITKESDNALGFLKENSPSRFETFLIQYKSKIDNWVKFTKDFNNKVVVEGLEFDSKKLFARLETYAGNWILNNQKRKDANPVVEAKKIKWS